ncbi:MAG: DUF3073 domain-containing protein [Pseudonocardiales bacterium]|nr:DUF3073 domain-containing protein [Pseudonocardiales bacterium]
MGRGRAKAKQTKVARELKYSSPATDLEALQRELSGGNGSHEHGAQRRSDDGHADEGRAEEDRAEETYPDEADEYRR